MNKLLVITGGTKGIGRAILDVFASEGFDILTCARSSEDLESLKKEFNEMYIDQTIMCEKVDLSMKEGRVSFCKLIANKNVDVLINNTGVFIPGTISDEEDGMLEKMIETNLYSAYDVSRAVVGGMKERKSGSIYNICSTASITAYENGGSYCVSKFALLGFSKVLRQELKEFGVKVTSILPGATYTSSWEGVDVPKNRFMSPEDIGSTVWGVYKLSDRTVVEELVLRPQLGDL